MGERWKHKENVEGVGAPYREKLGKQVFSHGNVLCKKLKNVLWPKLKTIKNVFIL